MGRKGRRTQGPQREPLAERLAKIKSKEVTQEFIKGDEEAFERVLEHRRHLLDSQELEVKKRIQVLKALCQKEEEEDLDVATLMEAQQTPPTKTRHQHTEGADQLGRELFYQVVSWLGISKHAWPRRRRRHP